MLQKLTGAVVSADAFTEDGGAGTAWLRVVGGLTWVVAVAAGTVTRLG